MDPRNPPRKRRRRDSPGATPRDNADGQNIDKVPAPAPRASTSNVQASAATSEAAPPPAATSQDPQPPAADDNAATINNFPQPDLLTVRELELEDVGAEVTVTAEVMFLQDVEMTEDEFLQ